MPVGLASQQLIQEALDYKLSAFGHLRFEFLIFEMLSRILQSNGMKLIWIIIDVLALLLKMYF